MRIRFIIIGILTCLVSLSQVNAQKTDIMEGRVLETVYLDKSAAPNVHVMYDLDLKSNIIKDGIMGAFVIAAMETKSFGAIFVAQTYEIKCDEKMIRFATASTVKAENGKFYITETRQLTGEKFANPFTNRRMPLSTRKAYQAILTRSCAVKTIG